MCASAFVDFLVNSSKVLRQRGITNINVDVRDNAKLFAVVWLGGVIGTSIVLQGLLPREIAGNFNVMMPILIGLFLLNVVPSVLLKYEQRSTGG